MFICKLHSPGKRRILFGGRTIIILSLAGLMEKQMLPVFCIKTVALIKRVIVDILIGIIKLGDISDLNILTDNAGSCCPAGPSDRDASDCQKR